MGEVALVGIMAILVAILFNAGGPKFYATSIGTKLQGNYAGRTLSTALVFFVAVLLTSFVLRTAYKSPLKD